MPEVSDADGAHGRSHRTGRLLAGLAWVVLLLGLWLWGGDLTAVRQRLSGPATGDIAAVGRPDDETLPPAAGPLKGAAPRQLDIPDLGVRAPVVARGLDARGAVDPPPLGQAGAVGWYGAGVKPGASGTALMVGRAGTGSRPAVFSRISTLRPGETLRVLRDDGTVADFTVDDVSVLPRGHADARQAYGTGKPGRAELRLITRGGISDDPSGHGDTADVVVSAYLTGTGV
ncbi:sortase [Streptomyces sp. Li-HN-5-11]|uniref:sortase domain-containing protein n=1 Tax=Streptomyces sp. Li-HN-5-11 TaxID=3075432 RepID=UPI0028AA3310|nr:sortase [Streptomyces sp. Li-HN-5-11]WNM35328.1 sortase [Streptomyces sp. Li-HN-5-11]